MGDERAAARSSSSALSRAMSTTWNFDLDLPPSYTEATRANPDNNNNNQNNNAGSNSNSNPNPNTNSSRPTNTTRHTLIYTIPVSRQQHHIPKPTRRLPTGQLQHMQFPPAFCLYSKSPRHYVIGESQDRPLYAVTTHTALLRPDLVLHSGVSVDSPQIATIDHDPFSRAASSITLPPRPGSRFAAANERLESSGAFTRVMTFSIETEDGHSRREHFEWRHSSGAEVEALGGHHSGWKLVRVSVLPPSSPPFMPSSVYNSNHHQSLHQKHRHHHSTLLLGGGGDRNGGGGGGYSAAAGANMTTPTSSDGREIVAVWAGAGMASVSKVLRFRFLGTGADGSLGDRWAIMAVASALAIWNRDRRSNGNGVDPISTPF